VLLEFPMDDAASGEREDALVEMGFYVPKEAEGFASAGDDTSAKARPVCPPPLRRLPAEPWRRRMPRALRVRLGGSAAGMLRCPIWMHQGHLACTGMRCGPVKRGGRSGGDQVMRDVSSVARVRALCASAGAARPARAAGAAIWQALRGHAAERTVERPERSDWRTQDSSG